MLITLSFTNLKFPALVMKLQSCNFCSNFQQQNFIIQGLKQCLVLRYDITLGAAGLRVTFYLKIYITNFAISSASDFYCQILSVYSGSYRVLNYCDNQLV